MSWFLLTIITISAVSAFPTDDSSQKDGHKIVGGHDAEIQDYPYQVSVEFRGRHNCGGTIVDKRHIVTAAHCRGVASELSVRVNSSFKNTGGKVIKVVQRQNHPKYSIYRKDQHDIAILKLAEALDWGVGIQPAKLPPNKQPLSAGDYVNITGWGDTRTFNYNGQLQIISVPIIDFKKCQDLYKNIEAQVRQGMVCAGLLEGGKDSCSGDSGGPLVANGILYGVASWGEGCALPKWPGVYADVAYYLDFVKDGMAL